MGADSHRRREPAAALPGRQPSALGPAVPSCPAAGDAHGVPSAGTRLRFIPWGSAEVAAPASRLQREPPGGTGAVWPLGCPFPSSSRKLCSSPFSMANIAFPFDGIRNRVVQPVDGKAGVPQPQTASVA